MLAPSLSLGYYFYVSLKAMIVSDAGTALKPWAMLQHAVDAIQHGELF